MPFSTLQSSLLVPIFENKNLKSAQIRQVLECGQGQRLWSPIAMGETPFAFKSAKDRGLGEGKQEFSFPHYKITYTSLVQIKSNFGASI